MAGWKSFGRSVGARFFLFFLLIELYDNYCTPLSAATSGPNPNDDAALFDSEGLHRLDELGAVDPNLSDADDSATDFDTLTPSNDDATPQTAAAARSRVGDRPVELVAYWTFDSKDRFQNTAGNPAFDGIVLENTSARITDAPGETARGDGALQLRSGPSVPTGTGIDIPGVLVQEGEEALSLIGWYRFADVDGDGSPRRNCLWSLPGSDSEERVVDISLGLDEDDQERDVEWTWTSSAPKRYKHPVGPVINDSDWHHAALTWNQHTGTAKYYHDGRLFDVQTIRGKFRTLPRTSGFRVGASLRGRDSWDGFIDDMAIFKSTLTASQVWALYEGYADPRNVLQVNPNRFPEEPMSFTAGSWSMAVIPDTQNYTNSSKNAPIFNTITEWIAANKNTRNIQTVLHLGDITNDNTPKQWERAKSALSVLDDSVPYILTLGNHDYKGAGHLPGYRRFTQLNTRFPMNFNPFLAGVFKDGELNNAYYEFVAPDGRKLVIFALEWAPRREVVDWALDILRRPSSRFEKRRYDDYTAVLLTHAYMSNDDLRIDWDDGTRSRPYNPHEYAGTLDSDCDGEALWKELVAPISSFEFTFSGHVTDRENDEGGMGFLRSEVEGGDHDHAVNQTLFNAQYLSGGGNGWILLVEFLPDGTTVLQKTYSPFLDSWRNEVDILQVRPI